jgi:hypothetical protein
MFCKGALQQLCSKHASSDKLLRVEPISKQFNGLQVSCLHAHSFGRSSCVLSVTYASVYWYCVKVTYKQVWNRAELVILEEIRPCFNCTWAHQDEHPADSICHSLQCASEYSKRGHLDLSDSHLDLCNNF